MPSYAEKVGAELLTGCSWGAERADRFMRFPLLAQDYLYNS